MLLAPLAGAFERTERAVSGARPTETAPDTSRIPDSPADSLEPSVLAFSPEDVTTPVAAAAVPALSRKPLPRHFLVGFWWVTAREDPLVPKDGSFPQHLLCLYVFLLASFFSSFILFSLHFPVALLAFVPQANP